MNWNNVLKIASKRISRQPVVPQSPYSIVEGQLCLCAGAALVSGVAEEVGGASERLRFERNLVQHRSSSYIVDAVSHYGLPGKLARLAIVINDGSTAKSRRSVALALFDCMSRTL
jgi:hypothetical protein